MKRGLQWEGDKMAETAATSAAAPDVLRDAASYTFGGDCTLLLNHSDHARHVLRANRSIDSTDTSRHVGTEIAFFKGNPA